METVTLKEAWSGKADCETCALRDSVLFAGLKERDFECIHKPIDTFLLPAGSLLYRAGSEGRFMYTIRRGLVKLVRYLPDGNPRIVRLLQGTDVAGLEALLGSHYQHDAVMLQTTEVCRLPIEVVKQLDRQNPILHQELMTRWQRALTEADAWLTELSTGSAKRRVACLLLRLVHNEESDLCELFSREDMGAMLGLTTETTSRIIAEFRRQGLLSIKGQNHSCCDISGLREVAES